MGGNARAPTLQITFMLRFFVTLNGLEIRFFNVVSRKLIFLELL